MACSTTPGRQLEMGEGRRCALTISVLLKLAAEPRKRKQRRRGTNGSSLSPYLLLALEPLPGNQVGRVEGRREGFEKKREERKNDKREGDQNPAGVHSTIFNKGFLTNSRSPSLNQTTSSHLARQSLHCLYTRKLCFLDSLPQSKRDI